MPDFFIEKFADTNILEAFQPEDTLPLRLHAEFLIEKFADTNNVEKLTSLPGVNLIILSSLYERYGWASVCFGLVVLQRP